ncbi:Phosphate regulon sensor protein PhoR (SphS) [Desulfurella amilsii]|uniref:Phosphate regulon sensor protein PhoR (SphS) n=2 Tax=Desulfurella amilsii TaxID=1562698 RepID=A0A1X4XXP6_9BACT|nr:Phosphate regulon sensor protein PhoR (SphS) [Desulfurella amilsii]
MLIFFDSLLSYQRYLDLQKNSEGLAKRVIENIELSIKTTGIYQSKPQDIFYLIIDTKNKVMSANVSINKEIIDKIIKSKEENFQYSGLSFRKISFEDATLGHIQIIAAYSLYDIYKNIAYFFGLLLIISFFIVALYHRISYVLSQKRSVPLLSLYRTTEEFLDTVAHEVLTPLSYISLISEDTRVKNSIDRIKNILNGVLEIKKFDVTKNQDRSEIDTKMVIKTILQELDFALKSKKIEPQLNLDEAKIITHQNIFYILLRNLIDNGVKYNIEGGFLKIESRLIGKYYHFKIENSYQPSDMDLNFQTLQFGRSLGLYLIYKTLNILNGDIDIATTKDIFKATIKLPIKNFN